MKLNNRKHPPISVHKTLNGQLKVDWEKEYNNEFTCPKCETRKLTHLWFSKQSICQLVLGCSSCRKKINLTNKVQCHIFNYCFDQECPNPLCNEIGPDGQKGWIYQANKNSDYRLECYFCGINFNPDSTYYTSWVKRSLNDELSPFNFNEDSWDLRHFYDEESKKSLYFQKVNPNWYRLKVKEYCYYLLKTRKSSSTGYFSTILSHFKQFGQVLQQHKIQHPTGIVRGHIVDFLARCQTNSSKTIKFKLYSLKEFFDWLDLETSSLIIYRDFPKINSSDTDWLDEITRQSIKQHLDKIPAPIACHYLVQLYLAARPRDVCQLEFNCLEEENGQWYVKFFQQKIKRWHRILATREIRRIIEEQQQWIRQTLGQKYEYLFCHFCSINISSYPNFFSIKPLPYPPKVTASSNPMVRIIRMLIEKENVLDANGQKPHFTGKITRSSRLQEVRVKYGIEAAQLYADHKSSTTTFKHYAPPTREQIAEVDLPFQELLMNPDNKFLPWQSLPESLLKNPNAHELDLEIQ